MQLDASSCITFTYNSDGIRTQKCYRNNADGSLNTRTATLDGTKIISEQIYDSANSISTTLYYLYDEKGDVVGLQYSNVPYYFQKNVQGDVIRIVNPDGTVVVEYTYDAWGNILSVTGTLADTIGQYNPFRYRSYYYDSETGLYYLQSRYYDPAVGRFLNADGIVGANGGIQGYNMFAYCNNNPVMYDDPSGNVIDDTYYSLLEQRILELNSFYNTQDNFGFVGDIKVGFDTIGNRIITIDDFVRAMRNVGFRSTPALIERYNYYVKNENIPISACFCGVASINITAYVGPVAIEHSYVVDKDSNSDYQKTVTLGTTLALGVEVSASVSTAQNVSDITGGSIQHTTTVGKGVYGTGSVSIMSTGYMVFSAGVFIGVRTDFLINDYPSISWTWS